MNVKPAYFKQRKCYALIWETATEFEISLLADDNKQLVKILEGMAHQIAVDDLDKLHRTQRFGVYVGQYFQSLFKLDEQQPFTVYDLAPELDCHMLLIFKDVYRNIDCLKEYREDYGSV